MKFQVCWSPKHDTWTRALPHTCLLYTSDAADERSSVDLGGRRIIKKTHKQKKKKQHKKKNTQHT